MATRHTLIHASPRSATIAGSGGPWLASTRSCEGASIVAAMAFNVRQIFAAFNDADAAYVPVASIDHLIVMKEQVARRRDLDDIAKLRQIRDAGSGQ